MSMAFRFETTSQWPAIYYVQHQTFIFNELNITPPHALAAGNSAPHSFITRLHKIYAFILPALLAMLQVLSVGNKTSPFEDHPVTTGASVFGMLGYYLSFMAWLRYPLYATQSSIAMAVFGSLSLASLVTLLLPDSCWYIKCIFYVLLVLLELHQLLKVYLRRGPTLTARHLLPLTHMDLREHSTTISTAAVTNAEISGRRPSPSVTVNHFPPSATGNRLRGLGYCPSPPLRLRHENTPLQDGGAQALTVGDRLSAGSQPPAMPASDNPPLQDGGAQALPEGD